MPPNALVNEPLKFRWLYDLQGLSYIHAALIIYLLFTIAWLLAERKHGKQFLDALLLIGIAAIPRIYFFQKSIFRTAHFFMNLRTMDDPSFYSFGYPVSLNALMRLIIQVGNSSWDRREVAWYLLLVLGILSPAVFYLLSLRLTPNRKLALTMGLLLALNPAHVMFSGPYDFIVASVFFEVLSHMLLLIFFQTGRPWPFIGFLMSSYLFYLSRPENSVVFFLHAICIVVAFWKVKTSKLFLTGGALVFFAMNFMFQYDWALARTYDVHVVQDLYKSPIQIFHVLSDPEWNHFIDWRWCPPYILLFLIIGTWRMIKERSVIHLYPWTVFTVFLLVYSNIGCYTVHGNARYFLNVIPAVFLVMNVAVGWIYARYEKAFYWTVGVAVAVFALYVPKLADNKYITQNEWDFYYTQARAQVAPGHAVWKWNVMKSDFVDRLKTFQTKTGREIGHEPPEALANEFEDQHLFEEDRVRVVNDQAQLNVGDYLFVGSNCYQFVLYEGKMVPECEAALHDPRNEVVLKSEYPTRIYHVRAPWVRSEAWRNFATTTFYLLQRKSESP